MTKYSLRLDKDKIRLNAKDDSIEISGANIYGGVADETPQRKASEPCHSMDMLVFALEIVPEGFCRTI